MQLLPSSDLFADTMPTGGSSAQKTYKAETSTNGYNTSDEQESFETLFSSFIEEDRIDYTGLPTGFSSFVTEGGTLTREQIELLKNNLKKSDTHSASIDGLNQLLSSGAPLNIGRVFSQLSETRRMTGELTDEDKMTLRSFMSKLQASSEEIDNMLAASDSGEKKAVWNTIAARMNESNEIDFSHEEIKALLKGLDLSKETSSFILTQIGKEKNIILSRDQLSQLLSSAQKELIERDAAQEHVRGIMRNSIVKTLEESHIKKLAAPVADMRGNRRLEQTEELMNASSMKKNGLNDLITRVGTKDTLTIDDQPPKDEKNSAFDNKEKPSFTKPIKSIKIGTVSANIPSDETEKAKNSASHMFARIDTQFLNGNQTQGRQNNLNELARQHRQEIFTQVESGILHNKSDGSHQLTLQLDPSELGQLTLILSVKQGEVRAIIRADQHESAAAISDQLGQLKASLEKQGLKVAEIEVRTGLHNDTASDQWDNSNDHNMMRNAHERDRNRQLAYLRKDTGESIKKTETLTPERANTHTGMHIVA